MYPGVILCVGRRLLHYAERCHVFNFFFNFEMYTHLSSVKLQWLLYNFSLTKWNVSLTKKLWLNFDIFPHDLNPVFLLLNTQITFDNLWNYFTQVSFSDRFLSVIRRRRCRCKIFHFIIQNQLTNFTQTWHTHPWVKGIQVCSNEELCRFTRGAYYTLPKYANIFFQNN